MVLFLLKPLHSKEIFLSENFLLKTASVKLSMVTSSIKGFHVYWRSSDIGEWLKCLMEETNRHNSTAIKVAGDANETIGHIPRSGSRTAATSKMEYFVNYYHKALHLGCCSSPRSLSVYLMDYLNWLYQH